MSFELIRELWGFVKARRKFLLIPIIFILLLLAVFIIFAESSALAPFIYTLF